jgi:hypothetical protein
MNFILFILGTLGLTHIVVEGTIFNRVRPYLGRLGDCFQCAGFWSGGLIGYILFQPSIPILACFAFAGSYLSMLSDSFIARLER